MFNGASHATIENMCFMVLLMQRYNAAMKHRCFRNTQYQQQNEFKKKFKGSKIELLVFVTQNINNTLQQKQCHRRNQVNMQVKNEH